MDALAPRSLVDELLFHASRADRRSAAATCARLIREGLTMTELVETAIAPTMREVGRRWQDARWTVADEHASTIVAESALFAAGLECATDGRRGQVVVACAEGDWHSLPSRMVAEVIASQGWWVRFLGASQPASSLAGYLIGERPVAVILTCSRVTSLAALMESVAAGKNLGVPVFVGGSALGTTPARALALGADGWGRGAADAAGLLSGHPRAGHGENRVGFLPEWKARAAFLPGWAAKATARLTDPAHGLMCLPPDVGKQVLLTPLDLLEVVSVALLLDEPMIFEEHCRWISQTLRQRGVPLAALTDAVSALIDTRTLRGDIVGVLAMLRTLQASLPLLPEAGEDERVRPVGSER